MNRKIIISLVVIIVLAFAITAIYMGSESGFVSNNTNPIHINPEIVSNISSANNEFAIDFYKQVSDNDRNIFFSPVSMYMAFSTLYEGAKSYTAEQIQDVFELDPDTGTRHESMEQFVSYINQRDPYSTLEIANALWLADRFDVHDSYVDLVRRYYDSHVETLDLPRAGEKRIDDWVAKNTNDKIRDLVSPADLTPSTAAVITNAIYFAGKWEYQFPTKNTHAGDFQKNSAESVNVSFMNVREYFYHAQLDDVQVIKMPYKGDRLSMLVILPRDINGITSLEESITAETVKQWKKQMFPRDTEVTMPKFRVDTNYDLRAILKNLGITDVFDKKLADLSGVGNADDNLFVEKALQKAFVNVDEEGTEAAAATGIIITTITEPSYFLADHPFIFIIQDDETETILFMGRVLDPTA